MDNMDDRLKYVDDPPELLKFTVDTTQAMPQFSHDLLIEFKEECSADSLKINERKTKIVRLNPLKRDLVYSAPWFPLVSSGEVMGVNFSADYSGFQVDLT